MNNAISLSPFAGVRLASVNMATFEQNFRDFNVESYWEEIEFYKYGTFVMITLAEIIILQFLGFYLEWVVPSEYGAKEHPCFCCRKKSIPLIWAGQADDKAGTDPSYIEEVEAGLLMQKAQGRTLTIENLRKEYSNGKVAVQKLDLEMYTDQIFALLGHNGAGKSTTISVISGLLEKSAGKIDVYGLDSVNDRAAIQNMMGVCPQVNPIYPELTVEEHMDLYAVMKGMTKVAEIKSETEKILTNIDLYHKLKYPAGQLSGGQKRKLCVSIALIGDSKIILLDEPTSGMDTFARRHLWEMLKIYKKDKLIILTTHYMDEADFLGDRIAIMGEGRLITCGSSLFLKEKFGCGYDLTVVGKHQNVNFGAMKEVIRARVPHGKEVGVIGMELKFQLPVEDSVHFQELFKEFEDRKDELGIQTFGVSLTTLEEVFLKVAQLGDHSLKEMASMKLGRSETKKIENVHDKELSELRVKGSVFWMHFWALIKKRFIYFKKDTKSIVCEVVLPSIIIILGSLITLITFWNSSPMRPILPDFATPKYDFYSSYNTAASGWATAFAGVGTSELNVTRLTACDSFSTVSTYEDCLITNTPTKKDNANLFDFYGDAWDNTNKQYSYTTFSNSTWPYAGFIANNLANIQILKSATGVSTASLKMTLYPMPLSHWQVQNDKSSDALTSCL